LAPQAWETGSFDNGTRRIGTQDRSLLVEAEPMGSYKWVYPVLKLSPDLRLPQGPAGLCFDFELVEGQRQFRGIFEEENGSSYVVNFLTVPKPIEAVEAVA
jgi:hypothetical protein